MSPSKGMLRMITLDLRILQTTRYRYLLHAKLTQFPILCFTDPWDLNSTILHCGDTVKIVELRSYNAKFVTDNIFRTYTCSCCLHLRCPLSLVVLPDQSTPSWTGAGRPQSYHGQPQQHTGVEFCLHDWGTGKMQAGQQERTFYPIKENKHYWQEQDDTKLSFLLSAV